MSLVIQLNCNITPHTQINGSVPQDCPHLGCQLQVPGCHHYFWPTGYKFRCHNTLLRFDNSLGKLSELWKLLYLLWLVCYRDKTQEWAAKWKQRWGGTHRASMPSPGMPPSQHVHLFTSPKALPVSLFKSFNHPIFTHSPLLRGAAESSHPLIKYMVFW